MALSRVHTSTKAQQPSLIQLSLIQYQIKHSDLLDLDFFSHQLTVLSQEPFSITHPAEKPANQQMDMGENITFLAKEIN